VLGCTVSESYIRVSEIAVKALNVGCLEENFLTRAFTFLAGKEDIICQSFKV